MTVSAARGLPRRESRVEPILWVIIGFISGTAAGAMVPGRTPGGWLGAVALGMVAGLIGGWVAKLFGLGDSLTWIGSLVVALVGCLGVLFVARPDRSDSSV